MSTVPKHRFEPSLDPAARARAWCEGLSPVFDVCLERDAEFPAWAALTSYNFGLVLLGSVSAPSQRLERDARMVARQGLDHVLVQLYLTGESRVQAGRRDSAMKAGQMVAFDLSQPVVTEAGAVSALNIMLPRKLLGDHIAAIENIHGQPMDYNEEPAAQVFRTYLSGLVNCAGTVESRQALALSQVAVDLCGSCFAPGEETVRSADQLTSFAIRQLIEEELGNEDLGVDTVLDRFGLSRTTLYRLFEVDGGAANYIRERRLLRALRLLTQPGSRPRVSAVAYSTGFSDEKTFSRAFRRRFGFLPREAGTADGLPRAGDRDEPVLMSWMKSLTV